MTHVDAEEEVENRNVLLNKLDVFAAMNEEQQQGHMEFIGQKLFFPISTYSQKITEKLIDWHISEKIHLIPLLFPEKITVFASYASFVWLIIKRIETGFYSVSVEWVNKNTKVPCDKYEIDSLPVLHFTFNNDYDRERIDNSFRVMLDAMNWMEFEHYAKQIKNRR